MGYRRRGWTVVASVGVVGLIWSGPASAATSPPLPEPAGTATAGVMGNWGAPTSGVPGHGPRQDPKLKAAADKAVKDGAQAIVARVDRKGPDLLAAAGARYPGRAAKAGVDDQFRIGSNTKSMVAVAVMQLVDKGVWSLETTVDQVWPGLIGEQGKKVTLHELLQHSSGIPDGVTPALLSNVKEPTQAGLLAAMQVRYTPEEVLAASNAQPWSFEPGTKAEYSNTGYVVLGMLLEKVTGKKVADLLRERVFKPAGMWNTFYATRPGMPRKALMDTYTSTDGAHPLAGFDPELFSTAGAVTSTTHDLNAFSKALLTGRLVSKKSLAAMQTTRPVTLVPGVEPQPYGLGIYPLADPCKAGAHMWGHDGATFGTFSVSYGSTDGKRQVSAGWTGRYYAADQTNAAPPYDIAPVVNGALLASC